VLQRTGAWLLAVTFAVTACSSSTRQTSPGGHSTSSSPARPATVVTYAQNGHLVAARVGDVVQVQLDSTYWRFAPVTGRVLHDQDAPSFAPDASCVPGGGCGTITQSFRAVSAGTAHITASRTTCGEALRCAPNQSTFSVTIVVR
jgi:hypothetical protein